MNSAVLLLTHSWHLCVDLCVHKCTVMYLYRTTQGNQSSSHRALDLIELRTSGLEASILPCWSISQAVKFLRKPPAHLMPIPSPDAYSLPQTPCLALRSRTLLCSMYFCLLVVWPGGTVHSLSPGEGKNVLFSAHAMWNVLWVTPCRYNLVSVYTIAIWV